MFTIFCKASVSIASMAIAGIMPISAAAAPVENFESAESGRSSINAEQMTPTAPNIDEEATAVIPQNAFGGQPINSFSYTFGGVDITVPQGCFLNHYIDGQDRKLNRATAGVDCAGPVALHPGLFCNYKFRFDYYDTNNSRYASRTSRTVNNCDTITEGADSAYLPRTVPRYGRACVTFVVNGTDRATQCHSIVRG